MRRLIIALCLLCSSSAYGANFSGKWLLPLKSGFGASNRIFLSLNQSGSHLYRTVAGFGDVSSGSPFYTELLDAKVEGDTVSFYVWRGSDEPRKWFFKGTLSNSDEIVFQITDEPARRPAPRADGQADSPPPSQVTATRTE